jgi:NodT family efflux transporter outer membrane factor (OMF) lipoprotein
MDRSIPVYPKYGSGFVRLLMLATSLLACGACTSPREYLRNGFKVGPNFTPPMAQVEEHWIDQADVRVRDQSDVPLYWWTLLHDPMLDGLVQQAANQNLTLAQAGYRILQARAQLGIAVGSFFPQQQDTSGSYQRLGAGGDFFNQWAQGFTLAWELDFWGRYRRAILASDAQLGASLANYDDVLVTLLGDVANNYVAIRVNQERIRLLDNNLAIQGSVLTIGEQRLAAGRITSVDVDQLRSNLAQNKGQREQLYINIRQAANRLCILLGEPPRDLDEELGKQPIPIVAKDVAVGIPADLLRRRPDVRRAELQVAAQTERVGIAMTDLYPAISIRGTMGYQSRDLSQLFTSDSFVGTIGPSFRWNVLNYGRLINNVRFEDAALQETIAAYQQTVLTANGEVENAMVAFLRAQRRAQLYDESAVAAANAVTVMQQQLQVGQIDFNQYATIQQNLIQVQDLGAQTRGEIVYALIQIYRALGGGWEIARGTPGPVIGAISDAAPAPAEEPEAVPTVPAER